MRSGIGGDATPVSAVLQHVLRRQQHAVLEQPDLHLLALAGVLALGQRRERADHAEHAAHDVVDRRAGAQRAAGRAGHVGEAGHHLHHFVERDAMLVGPGQEALVRHVDQPLVLLLQRRVVEAVFRQRAGAEILAHDVGGRDQLLDRARDPSGRQGPRVTLFLLRLNRREEAGARADQPARLVAARRLDLDHLGAEVAEDHAAGRPHHHVAELDHADAAEGKRAPPRSFPRTRESGPWPKSWIPAFAGMSGLLPVSHAWSVRSSWRASSWLLFLAMQIALSASGFGV